MLDLFETTWEDVWAGNDSQQSYGAVFTRAVIVELILDLVGYNHESGRLATRRVLEPSCGEGAFVMPILQRLIHAEKSRPHGVDWKDSILNDALRAVDLHAPALDTLRGKVIQYLVDAGCPQPRAADLAARWLVRTDFLQHDWTEQFDLVVGNPPYVRIEDIPRPVLQHYRSRFPTLGDRADLYVAFIERGLQLLAPPGVLGFITANRFVKNTYGRGVRKLIADRFHVRYFLNLEHTQPFESEVSAYPAITIIDLDRGNSTRAGELQTLEEREVQEVRRAALKGDVSEATLQEFDRWYPDGGPWITTCRTEQQHIDSLRRRFVPLEESAPDTRVGIGVATGADRIFILKAPDPAIEADRQIPLALSADLSNQGIEWSGHIVLNPFAASDDGTLVDLDAHPGMRMYLQGHRDRLMSRHVARSRPHQWYRTIDRIWPKLQSRPKLLIPDIQPSCSAIIAHDHGSFYPHHNLYWITSESWSLPVLKALLRSSPILEQVRAHSVQMRGGSVRWQAQTLRKLLLPPLESLSDHILSDLSGVSDSKDQREIDEAAVRAFHT